MGKKTRKTRWRTLAIGDEQSDSEESNSTLDTRVPPTYHQKYYNRFTYSSQSTPTRRYQSDSNKSTRSSSTASENKITFNEDEYTRITTPRQDVLFKKGYLNKPKTYSTQTSTGNSSTSTGNSTGNGTPEYQSTDLEYESQFMFPNGFLDQNGIYYVNSYEPYPLMVYNAPTYYNNDSCERSKKYSTESLADTASTSNEETSQETANYNGVGHGEEIQQTTPPQQVNGHHPQPHMPPAADYGQVYNVVYPGFYYNGLCPPQELVNCQNHNLEQPKRIKRRRRRKFPNSDVTGDHVQNGNASEYTEDEFSSVEEEEEPADERPASEDHPPSPDHSTSVSPPTENQTNENSEAEASSPDAMDVPCDSNDPAASDVNCDTEEPKVVEDGAPCNDTSDNSTGDDNQEEKKVKYDLKPDAQEFVPRALRPENLQYFKIQPGFVPIPMMSPLGAPPYGHPAYLPHGMPLGYIQQNPAMYPGFVPGYIPSFNPETIQAPMGATVSEIPPMDVAQDHQQESRNKNDIDIKTVVSKLEEVANDSQKPDKRNASPYKKPRNYEDRKKFFHKNNNIQNGYYQKKTNVKYQTINNSGANPSSNLNQDDANDTKECTKIIEEPILECPQEEQVKVPEILPESKDPPLQPDTSNEQKEMLQSSMKPKSNDDITTPKLPEALPKEKTMDVEKPINSPNFQQRPTNTNKPETPKTPNKDNNYSDPRTRWPRKEEKNYQRWDQGEERSNQGYKQNNSPNHRFNQKFTPNSPARKQNGVQTNHHYNDNTKKYSETVKKTQLITTKTVIRENTTKTFNEIKPVIPEVTNTLTNKTQWIPVSNKKKRRNKNVEDNNEAPIEEKEEEKQPQPPVIGLEDFQQNAFLQNIINGHSKVEESEKIELVTDIISKSPVKILEVRDLEKELLSNVGVEIKEESESLIAEVKIIEPTKQKLSSKKKSKKGGQKQTTKRVFITDLDLSGLIPGGKQEEQKEDPEEAVEIVENIETIPSDETQNVDSKVDVVTEVEEEAIEKECSEQEVPKQEVIPLEQTEKKSKKKKKKSKSVETSTSTPTNSENTYDFLLENTLSNNSDDKTNMEISQELDLIIQRGMYNSLEEKIKALNIIPIKEEFFQSVVRSSRESSTEKTPEFTKLLANSMPKFKYCMASVEDETPKTMIDLNQPSTSRNDLFVENPEVNELLKDIYGKEGTPEAEIGDLITRLSPPKEIRVETVKEESVERKLDTTPQDKNETDKEKLYPITQAVKNWMSKTRENTPEVEILKSPSKIFKEFCEMDDTTRNVLTNGKRNSAISESDEEVTVYSASRNNSGAADLLDCWENEISLDSNGRTSIENTESKGNSDSNEDDEVLEVYESKYGQNEDFLELQREIEEKKKQEQEARSRNFPKHGALPYRAICCNVM